MIRLVLNGLGASAGSGLTYLFNVVPLFSSRPDVHTILLAQPKLRAEFEKFPRVELPALCVPASAAARFYFEQQTLPGIIRELRGSVLVSLGNFALRNSPVPQILLSGNSLYTSLDFRKDLRNRREYIMLADNALKAMLARRSVHWADITVAPSHAFAEQLRHWSRKPVTAIHHGFDRDLFVQDETPLPAQLHEALAGNPNKLNLLYVSHYNYYRNFETLLRAVAILRQKMGPGKLRLFLTCKLKDGLNPGAYKASRASELVNKLGIREEVVELGAVTYRHVHKVYRACDMYVTSAYTETFAHPLVEAMASSLPIVASDLAVHREIAGDAALYFSPFSAEHLAEKIESLAAATDLRQKLCDSGRYRVARFSWSKHIAQLLDLARGCAKTQGAVHLASLDRCNGVNPISVTAMTPKIITPPNSSRSIM